MAGQIELGFGMYDCYTVLCGNSGQVTRVELCPNSGLVKFCHSTLIIGACGQLSWKTLALGVVNFQLLLSTGSIVNIFPQCLFRQQPWPVYHTDRPRLCLAQCT